MEVVAKADWRLKIRGAPKGSADQYAYREDFLIELSLSFIYVNNQSQSLQFSFCAAFFYCYNTEQNGSKFCKMRLYELCTDLSYYSL